MPDVVVVGAGPVGMLLAGELARRGVEVEILEKRPAAGAGTRAIGIHSPVLGALEASGVTERLLASAQRVLRGEARSRGRMLGVVRFDRLPVRFPFVATLPQSATEAVLAARAPEPLRGARVLAVIPRRERVVVRAAHLARPLELDARAVVVAAGSAGRGLVYRPGAVPAREYRDRYLMTDAAAPARADTAIVHLDPDGVLESFPLPGGMRRFVAWDAPVADAAGVRGESAREGPLARHDTPPARVERLREAMVRRGEPDAAAGVVEATDFGVRRFVAPRLRHGRVFAIGDTAHEVTPIGGQGMNLGLLDAVTLAPLLAAWMHTGAPPETELRRWEARRVRSARTAALLASANTALGRRTGLAEGPRRATVRAMLAGASGRVFGRAYAMGFDADA